MAEFEFIPFKANSSSGQWVVSVGNFDGIHLGHRYLLDKVKEEAGRLGCKSGLVTFEPYPREVLKRNSGPCRIYRREKKTELLADCGLDGCFVFKFDELFASITAEDFLENTLASMADVRALVVGTDFGFGKGRAGNAESLARRFDSLILPPLVRRGKIVSSSLIRGLVKDGLFEEASFYLDRPWSFSQKVAEGKRRAREWNYPTANLPELKGVPLRYGVYGVEAKLEERRLKGVMNFGRRPSFEENVELAEIHLFDFAETIYGRTLEVFPRFQLRDEHRFDSVENLRRQIRRDVAETLRRFDSCPSIFEPKAIK